MLSVPFARNKFIRANYNDSARLWTSARAEVQALVGLLPAIVSSWKRGWCSSIVVTDASEYGFGVCLKKCKRDVCEIIGRTSERARFRKCLPDTPGETSDDFPNTDEDCHAPPLAVDVRGLDQTNAWSGKQLVPTPPPSSKRRAEQNTKLGRHEDHQKSCIPGYRPSIRKGLRVPIQRPLQKASESNRSAGTDRLRSHRLRSRRAYL